MAARHRSRQRALQVLYQCDLRKQPVDDAIASFYDTLYSEEQPLKPEPDAFMEELARGASAMSGEIDRQIAEKAENWKLDRMPLVDRNVLRLAIYEMSRKETPPAVVIDEALELARQFAGDESVSFINAVLDAVHRQQEAAERSASE
ncbi:MAG TPA: transcription antitermination factor NusB [Bryobacteraceae bacterium]|nr:transcription antitermination factor NusB [Bryobacteraceae bacterium]